MKKIFMNYIKKVVVVGGGGLKRIHFQKSDQVTKPQIFLKRLLDCAKNFLVHHYTT